MKYCQKVNLQEPQRNRNATANFVNLIMTSTVRTHLVDNAQIDRKTSHKSTFWRAFCAMHYRAQQSACLINIAP